MNQKRTVTRFLARSLLQLFCLLFLLFLLLRFPRQTAGGVTDGLRLCFSSVIGSLLPFMVLSSLLLRSGAYLPAARLLERSTKRLLRLPGCCAAVVLLSLVGGYPVGASMTALLLQREQINAQQSKRLLLFCVCPGPAFAVLVVGVQLLQSVKAGAVIYLSVVLSSLLLGVLSRAVFSQKNEDPLPVRENAPPPFAAALEESVRESVFAMLLICGWIALFSALLSILALAPLPEKLQLALTAALEVTNGCRALCGVSSLPVLCAAVAWGGVCTHCQISPYLHKCRMPLWLFWLGRAAHAALAFGLCVLLLKILPVEQSAVFQDMARLQPTAQPSFLGSACMLIMCALLLVGSRFSLRVRGLAKPDAM